MDISVAPLSVVFDPVVWRRFYRYFAGGALEKTWSRERKDKTKKKDKKKGVDAIKSGIQFFFTFTVESLLLVAPGEEDA